MVKKIILEVASRNETVHISGDMWCAWLICWQYSTRKKPFTTLRSSTKANWNMLKPKSKTRCQIRQVRLGRMWCILFLLKYPNYVILLKCFDFCGCSLVYAVKYTDWCCELCDVEAKGVTRIFFGGGVTLSLSAIGASRRRRRRGWWGLGRGCPPPQKIFAFFISKWWVFVHACMNFCLVFFTIPSYATGSY